MLMPAAGIVTVSIGAYAMLWSALDVKTKALPRILMLIGSGCVAACGVYAISATVICF